VASPEELVRLRMGPAGELLLGSPGGRGAWLCRGSPACLEEAERRRVIERALRAKVSDEAVKRAKEAMHALARDGGPEPGVCEDGTPGAAVCR
jgi:predicted RNA-binding protein YlxR (DUF448 family)